MLDLWRARKGREVGGEVGGEVGVGVGVGVGEEVRANKGTRGCSTRKKCVINECKIHKKRDQ